MRKVFLSFSRKRWFDDRAQQSTNNSSTERTADIQLSIHRILPAIDQPFFDKYKTVFVAVPFIHLNIDYLTILNEMLVKIIQILPNLVSLKVSSLQVHQPGSSDVKMCGLPSTNNKITKVCHKNTTDMKQVDFLLHLCRCMEHFQMDLSQTIDLNLLLQHILRKVDTCVPQLRSLCLGLPNASEITTHQVKNHIDSESLLSNYAIKRCGDYIHLQWV